MELEFKYTAEPSQCVYLSDQTWRLEYAFASGMTESDYHGLIQERWRRFGYVLFRPRCPSCNACIPIRVITGEYRPNRSQRRVIKANQDSVRLEVDGASITSEKISLYMRHHTHHAKQKGWPLPSERGAVEHINAIMEGPLAVEEWCYYIGEKLVAVSYMDVLKDGFSGIYFFYDPDFNERSLGTWIVISMIKRAAELGLPYAYLGYFIKGCRSMEYKGLFDPSETLGSDGRWHPFIRE